MDTELVYLYTIYSRAYISWQKPGLWTLNGVTLLTTITQMNYAFFSPATHSNLCIHVRVLSTWRALFDTVVIELKITYPGFRFWTFLIFSHYGSTLFAYSCIALFSFQCSACWCTMRTWWVRAVFICFIKKQTQQTSRKKYRPAWGAYTNVQLWDFSLTMVNAYAQRL